MWAAKQQLERYPATRYWVGYSGGRDSHVLLHWLWQLSKVGQLTTPIVAIHVNHRLQKLSDSWVTHCQRICDEYGIELLIETVTQKPQTGESIEAFARQQRYGLIEKHLKGGDIFISAHHQRDQAETFLLQLMRGAGLDGLQSMPLIRPFGAGQYLRPLLNVGYADIVEYALQNQLDFVTDPSNEGTQFERNFFRHQVLPLLKQRFPQAEKAIARSAAWLAEVPKAMAPQKLTLTTLKQLPAEKQKQQVRAFVKDKINTTLSQRQTDYLIKHHLTAAADKQPLLNVGEYVIRRYADELLITTQLPHVITKDFIANVGAGQSYQLDKVAKLQWQTGQGGLIDDTYQLKPLSGATRFHPHTRSQRSSVKKLLHEYGIAPWLRPWFLGLYLGDELVAIPNVGVSITHFRQDENAQLPRWIIKQKFVKL